MRRDCRVVLVTYLCLAFTTVLMAQSMPQIQQVDYSSRAPGASRPKAGACGPRAAHRSAAVRRTGCASVALACAGGNPVDAGVRSYVTARKRRLRYSQHACLLPG